MHTASFWNITIQWTSYDDFTDFLLCLSFLNSNWKNLWNQSAKKVTQMIWQNFSVLALKMSPKPSNQSGSQIHAWIWLPDWFEGFGDIFKASTEKFCQIIWVTFFALWFHKFFQLLFKKDKHNKKSVKSSYEVHWIVMFQKDAVCICLKS